MSVVRCTKCDSPEVYGCAETACPERAYVPAERPAAHDQVRALQVWLRTEDRGNEYDSEAVADLIDEWLNPTPRTRRQRP